MQQLQRCNSRCDTINAAAYCDNELSSSTRLKENPCSSSARIWFTVCRRSRIFVRPTELQRIAVVMVRIIIFKIKSSALSHENAPPRPDTTLQCRRRDETDEYPTNQLTTSPATKIYIERDTTASSSPSETRLAALLSQRRRYSNRDRDRWACNFLFSTPSDVIWGRLNSIGYVTKLIETRPPRRRRDDRN